MAEPANELVEHFFRYESANLVAVMTRAFGLRRIELVEDVVQVAMLEAMQAWGKRGVPENPAGWIHRAAKNRLLDALRREKTEHRAVSQSGYGVEGRESLVDAWLKEERIPDSLLRMMFVCCHPSLDRKTQIALTLKTLCGFGVSEIARGLFLPDETVKKRIARARKSLASANVPLELPGDDEMVLRLDVVHEVLYLLFNEGYSTSRGPEPVCDDLCEEAARLCYLLCESSCASPATKALLALLLFHASRLEARTDETGAVVLLEDQDRTRWDRRLIGAAGCWLAKSKTDRPTRFHLEAAIAIEHCVAPSVEATDWKTIVHLYDRLLDLRDSPIYALNRAIAIGQAGDAHAAMSQLESLRDHRDLKNYLILDCAIARMNELQGDKDNAIKAYRDALAKKGAPHEQALLERKLRKLTG